MFETVKFLIQTALVNPCISLGIQPTPPSISKVPLPEDPITAAEAPEESSRIEEDSADAQQTDNLPDPESSKITTKSAENDLNEEQSTFGSLDYGGDDPS